MSITEQVEALQAERQRKSVEAWGSLLESMRRGKMPSAEKVIGVLEASGKTLDDLKAEEKAFAARIALRSDLDKLPAALKEAEAHNAEYRALEEARDEALRVFEEKTAPLHPRGEQINQVIATANAARQKLIDTSPHEAPKLELQAIDREAFDLQRELVRLRGIVLAAEHGAQEVLNAKNLLDKKAADNQVQAGRAKVAAGEIAKEDIQQIEKQIADLGPRREAAREKMLVP